MRYPRRAYRRHFGDFVVFIREKNWYVDGYSDILFRNR